SWAGYRWKCGLSCYGLRLTAHAISAQEGRHLVEGKRLADEVTLHLVATDEPKDLCLFLPLHTLRNGLEIQGAGQRDDRRDEGHGRRVVEHGGHERTIDLQGV